MAAVTTNSILNPLYLCEHNHGSVTINVYIAFAFCGGVYLRLIAYSNISPPPPTLGYIAGCGCSVQNRGREGY